LACVILTCTAQVPNLFNYQATLRDNNGKLLVSDDISLRISILQASQNGAPVYTETHSVTTTSQGIVNLKIGSGSTSDEFAAIDWSNGPYFLKIEINTDVSGNYTELGITQLLSVPYAFFAEKASNISNDYVSCWSKNNNNLYYNNGFVGIGTNNPITKLNIVGAVDDGDERSFIRLKNNSLGSKATVSISLQSFDNKGVALGYTSCNYTMNDLSDFGSITTNGRGLAFVTNYGQIRFYTNKNEDNSYSEKMRINEKRNVGIGTIAPNAKLEVADGDIYIKDNK